MELELDADLSFAATPGGELDFSSQEFTDRVGTGFNEHGVRINYDDDDNIHSVDVLFEAMEPGPPKRRNGVRITADFLRRVGEKDYSNEPPHLKDHRAKDTFADLGRVKDVWFSEQHQKLLLMTRVPNTGAPTHTEAVARYTFEPPAIRNGSVGFGNQYTAIRNEDGEPELQDATLREFSTVNFPGGYDEGGVATAFAEAAVDAADAVDADFDDESERGEASEAEDSENSAADSFSTTVETITF